MSTKIIGSVPIYAELDPDGTQHVGKPAGLCADLEKYYGTFDIEFDEDVVELLRAGLCGEIFRFQRTCVKPAKYALVFAQIDS